MVTKLTSMLKALSRDDPARVEMTQTLLDKLYVMGILTTKKSLVQCEKLSTSAFCRRRLPVIMVKLKMSETLREATEFVEQVCRTTTHFDSTLLLVFRFKQATVHKRSNYISIVYIAFGCMIDLQEQLQDIGDCLCTFTMPVIR